MPHVITQSCCNDASCVFECPIDCIRPHPDDPAFATADMLYIDPDSCIDCGACVDVCPVDAIVFDDELPPAAGRFAELNAAYFQRFPLTAALAAATRAVPCRSPARAPLWVAVVGSGPAACYATEELLRRSTAEIDIFERQPAPWGLLRYGVSPDHPRTRRMANTFAALLDDERVRLHLDVQIGTDITHDDLARRYHAVVYATGAPASRSLGIPGEDLPGSHSVAEFVGWYTGNPDYADMSFDLSGDTVVVIGNGNVALDVARILTADPDTLPGTDIADHALDALRASNVREVVILGRRGPTEAAYTTSEFLELGYLPNIDVVIDPVDLELGQTAARALDDDPASAMKMALAQEYSRRFPGPGHRRIVLRYRVAPIELFGSGHVAGVRVRPNGFGAGDDPAANCRPESIAGSPVLRSIGYRSVPIPGVPFDEQHGIIPNEHGHVLDTSGLPVAGVYVTGWAKRRPRGGIGTNRIDAGEVVDCLLSDFANGLLATPQCGRDDLTEPTAARRPRALEDHPG
ncbi:FAD-dependent oxidoreductase [Nocardia terpenica]|uniref:ferredoxin--NADP(+) reductase n=1 Tax=Nocardia terpenica TaxID=455432 RepID=A0A164IXN7_9NOCA|nr:FAD-dependent oxidoreductase [Nocardia terpenica]KZM69836.1 ferredoxin [Nocardia terpenica]NQE91189.1 4Fe-4S binding protein [Nocardia terpenica]